MNNPVMIKGNKYGIRLVLDPDLDFDILLSNIGQKFSEAERFFRGNASLALTIDGRVLSNEELDRLLSEIHEKTDIEISYVIDESDADCMAELVQNSVDMMESVSGEAIDADFETNGITVDDTGQQPDVCMTSASQPKMVYEDRETLLNNDSMFYKGTLRSGQSLESDGSIVILGDVNPGSSVISSGNIIVIGRLKGMVHAGATGNINAFVLALSMNPMQIRIADAIARSEDKPRRKLDDEAKIAFMENGNIYIEPVKKSVLNDIHL